VALTSATSAVAQPATPRPNIIYIVADDLGWKDVGFHGSDIKTPNLDKLAQEGARLEQFYVQPMCTPTRAALMTGRYPCRYGLQTLVIPTPNNPRTRSRKKPRLISRPLSMQPFQQKCPTDRVPSDFQGELVSRGTYHRLRGFLPSRLGEGMER
jgi:hypothetical protein